MVYTPPFCHEPCCVIILVFPFFRYLPKSKKAAALLLYNLWTDKELQSFLKKVSEIYPITWWVRVWVCHIWLFLWLLISLFTPHSGICKSRLWFQNVHWAAEKCSKSGWENASVCTHMVIKGDYTIVLNCHGESADLFFFFFILPLAETLWKSKGLMTNWCFLLQQGMSKSSFVNDVTMAANKSAQVVA